MAINQSTLTGAAGEYFVMYKLLRMGFIAALAPKGVPNADLIVTNIEGELTAAIQVKTRNKKGLDGGWAMREKHENLKSKNLFYCFVELDDNTSLPKTYVIPSTIVTKALQGSHKTWLSTPGKNNRPHKDNDMRRLLPDYKKILRIDNEFTKKYGKGWLDQYQENWKILNLQA